MTTNLQAHKLSVSTVKNLTSTFTNADGNNGTMVINKHNALVDATQNAIVAVENDVKALELIQKYPLVEPTESWGYVSLQIFINSSTGNDITGNGTKATPYATIERAIQHVASKKIDDAVDIQFYLMGNFTLSNGLDFSQIWVDIRNWNGSPVTDYAIENYNLSINFYGTGEYMNGNTNGLSTYTLTFDSTNYNRGFIILPKHLTPKKGSGDGISHETRLTWFSPTIVCDVPIQVLDNGDNISLKIYGATVTNTVNNTWTCFYIPKLFYFEVGRDGNNNNRNTIFTASDGIYEAIDCYVDTNFTLEWCTFDGYYDAVDLYKSSYTQIYNTTFINIQGAEVFNANDWFIHGNTTFKIIDSLVYHYLPIFVNGALPTLTYLEQIGYKHCISAISRKCLSGSATLDLMATDGSTSRIIQSDITLNNNTGKLILTATNRVINANEMLYLQASDNTAQNASFTVEVQAIFAS